MTNSLRKLATTAVAVLVMAFGSSLAMAGDKTFFQEKAYQNQTYTKIFTEVFWVSDKAVLDNQSEKLLEACKIMHYPYPSDADVIIFNGFDDRFAPWFSQRLVRLNAQPQVKPLVAYTILCAAPV